ncbi:MULTISPECIES: hypothetical protein [Bradyrhizobium]|uniref:hypothetical protein n=1 Tax=Bradyrhizobium TaxID=374 RepID=UPI002226A591|nr:MULTISPECIES: hypothetical protein [Bradyrhizobium]MCW2358841.1 hypothetical protein [Bradyrhizobium elkanii]MDI2055842.1 hypothetical protein [Bradyrhizobium sp. Mp19]
MKFLKEHNLDNPVCRFTVGHLDDVLVPYLKAKDDENQRKRTLAPFARKASVHVRDFGSYELVEFYVGQALWRICLDASDCDEPLPGRWWSAWRSARAKTFQFIADEVEPSINNGEPVCLETSIAAVVERYFTEDERYIAGLLTAWHGGIGPVGDLLFREWQVLMQLWEKRCEGEQRQRIGSREKQIARLQMYLDRATAPHLPALLTRYRKLVKTGAYGEAIFESWEKEVEYFGDAVLQMFHERDVTDSDFEREEIEEIAYERITELVQAALARGS